MIRPCIAVDKIEADITIKNIREQGLLDSNYRIEQIGDTVYIPLLRKSNDSMTHNFREIKDSISRIKEQLVESGINPSDISYIRLGDSLIFKRTITRKIACIFSDLPGIKNIYCETGKISGIKRRPSLKLMYGPGGETRVIEYGITYVMDLQKVMFSPGNINTRSKMHSVDLSGSTVMDMFCGIGYFSLPVLKNSIPDRMICCDINSDSLYYLKENLSINRINYPVQIFSGDSRSLLPFVRADYIIMGNFNSPDFLNAALIRSGCGTKISMHYLTTTNGEEIMESNIIKMARKLGFIIQCTYTAIVKSVGPKYIHINSIFTVMQKI